MRKLIRAVVPKPIIRKVKKAYKRLLGYPLSNQGAIREKDAEVLRQGVDEVNPKVFVELGTGRGVATAAIFEHLAARYPECDFYTIDIVKQLCDEAHARFGANPRFHVVHGLTVTREETTPPAYDELVSYTGPDNVLRRLLKENLAGRSVDVSFIDSRKGSALAEFKVLEEHTARGGIIFCHDILNGGKGVEVLEYLNTNRERFDFEVIDTGPEGMIKVTIRGGS